MIYRDLRDVGLPFLTTADPQFNEVRSQIFMPPFAPSPEEVAAESVIILNQSGQPVMAMSFLWRWIDQDGQITPRSHSGASSLSQLRIPDNGGPGQLRFNPFLPGSKRLVTPSGVFGDNSDVLPPEVTKTGFVGGYGGGRSGKRRGEEELRLHDMQLDSAIFADGLFAGPDEMGLFASLEQAKSEQQRLASEAAALLRVGARFGEVFELVRVAARIPPPPPAPRPSPPGQNRPTSPMRNNAHLNSFASHAVRLLTFADEERRHELIEWFDEQARSAEIKLHRLKKD